MASGFSYEGTGPLPAGRPVSAEELEALRKIPAARDLRTGEADLELDTLESFELEAQPVPVDITRFPFRATVFLQIFLKNGRDFRGTAYFISEHRLATAGHNLLYDEGAVDHVDVIVDVHGSLSAGTTRYTAASFRPHPSYFTGHRERDFGVVRLAEDVGRAVGFFALDDDAATGRPLNIIGYPETSFLQVASAGTIQDVQPARVFYDTVTSRGQSGGPAYLPHADPRRIVAVGIHTHGIPPGTFRSGLRVTTDVKNWLLSA